MATTSQGFDGSVLEDDISQILDGTRARATVDAPAAWLVTPVSGFRRVSVAPGIGTDAFVRCTTDAAVLIDLPLPSATGGQWHLIVARRNWGSNSLSFLALPHTTTTTTDLPSDSNDSYRDFVVPPSTRPALQTVAGGIKDQELAWAHVNTANNTVRLFDLRREKKNGDYYALMASYINGRSFDATTIANGVTKSIGAITINLSEAKRVEIHGEGETYAPGPAAGQVWLEVGGVQVCAKVRQHSHGGTNSPNSFHLIAKVTLPAGTSTATLMASSDGSGSTRTLEFGHLSVIEA